MGAVTKDVRVRGTHSARDSHAAGCELHGDAPHRAGGMPATRTRTARHLRGFTLLELMITLVVLAIGVLALGQLMPAGSRAMNRSRSVTSGTAFAAQKLEDLKALAWTDASLAAGTHTDTSGKYARTWIITDNTPLAGTKKVEVTVSWPSSSGTRSTVVRTYLTQLAN